MADDFKFDPERKRRQLERRGWTDKRIDSYLQHSIQFNCQSKANKERGHDESKRSN